VVSTTTRARLPLRLQLARQLEAGERRHLDVGQHDVRLRLLRELQRLPAVLRLRDDFDVVLDVEAEP
jgi:hypothetical protein